MTKRVLQDLSKVSIADLKAALAAQGVSLGASKEPGVAVIDYTPKKGKDAGKTVKRLQITGDFFPVLMNQKAVKVLFDVLAETDGMTMFEKFAKSGK